MLKHNVVVALNEKAGLLIPAAATTGNASEMKMNGTQTPT